MGEIWNSAHKGMQHWLSTRTGSFRRCSGTSILSRSRAFFKRCLWRTALTFFIYKHEVIIIIIENMRDQPKNSFCSEYSVPFPCSFKFQNWVKEETECSFARLMLQPLGFLLVTVDCDFLWPKIPFWSQADSLTKLFSRPARNNCFNEGNCWEAFYLQIMPWQQ